MITIKGSVDSNVLDDIIGRLLEGKGGKQVQLSEGEIRQLCVCSERFPFSAQSSFSAHSHQNLRKKERAKVQTSPSAGSAGRHPKKAKQVVAVDDEEADATSSIGLNTT